MLGPQLGLILLLGYLLPFPRDATAPGVRGPSREVARAQPVLPPVLVPEPRSADLAERGTMYQGLPFSRLGEIPRTPCSPLNLKKGRVEQEKEQGFRSQCWVQIPALLPINHVTSVNLRSGGLAQSYKKHLARKTEQAQLPSL